ncbi:unnamed protein product [Prorocentrum cordatum]|uniref:Serine protease n=1 Tax=Prorocentrum cordatum TaxID=2364126 RepID=A0ABN9V847_9DINO|nr:unnamed protein product [Polarella glacialis]
MALGAWPRPAPLLGLLALLLAGLLVTWRSWSGDVRSAASSVVRVRVLDPLRPWARSHGSGFVWDSWGHIVTNSHVIQGAALVSVQLADGSERRARVVGSSPDCDLAVLEVLDGTPALPPPLPLLRRPLRAGTHVTTVGHPGHWLALLGDGVVSAVGRRSSRLTERLGSGGGLRRFQRWCAVDGFVISTAAGGPGSSGGPLLTAGGHVAGVATWMFDGGRQPRIMVAIGVDVLRRVVPALVERGEYLGPRAGVEGRLASARLRLPSLRGNALLGLRGEGVRLWMPPGGAARAAGLRCFDEILQVGSAKPQHPADVLQAVQQSRPGSSLEVAFRRAGGRPQRALLQVGSSRAGAPARLAGEALRAALKAYALSRFARSVADTARQVRGDLQALRGAMAELLPGTGRDSLERGEQVLSMVARGLLEWPRSLCSAFAEGRACRRGPGAHASWGGVGSARQCRQRCESREAVAAVSCCMYAPEDKSCHLSAAPNASTAFEGRPGVGSAAVCRAIPPPSREA